MRLHLGLYHHKVRCSKGQLQSPAILRTSLDSYLFEKLRAF